jgi:hypothetical protein
MAARGGVRDESGRGIEAARELAQARVVPVQATMGRVWGWLRLGLMVERPVLREDEDRRWVGCRV